MKNSITLEGLERDALLDALKAYGPTKLGNHTLFNVLLQKLTGKFTHSQIFQAVCIIDDAEQLRLHPMYQVDRENLLIEKLPWAPDNETAGRLLAQVVSETDLCAAFDQQTHCDECGHKIRHHSKEYGCEVERGDNADGVAMGPCSCMAVSQ